MAVISVLPPLALYIHFPWCVKKCPYCDFNSHALKGNIPQTEYIDALLRNFQYWLPYLHDREIISIFMGGGTPSLFDAPSLGQLLTGLKQYCTFSPDIEITIEANPGTVEHAPFAAYREIGINRLSLGVQSFNSKHLHILGRIHDPFAALEAIHQAKAAGFDNFNIDLMFGLPEQSLEQGIADLTLAIEQNPSHLSWYELTLEPNTYFARFPPALPCTDLIYELQQAGQQLLSQQGFQQYEVSAFTKEQPCRHNTNYWEFGDYLAIGAGAHAKVTSPEGEIWRMSHWRHPKKYLDLTAGFIETQTRIPQEELPFEYMLNTLRLKQGTPVHFFQQRTGIPLAKIQPMILQAQQRGWLELSDQYLATTPLGYQFLNDVIGLFLSEDTTPSKDPSPC